MGWFYNTSSGIVTKQTGTIAAITGWINTHTPGLGWHELHIGDNATLAEAEAEARKEFPGAATPTGSTGQAVKQQVSSETGVPLTGLAAIGDFFQRLGQANTWIRVAQVLGGLILIAVGVARITHAMPAATKVAKAVGTKGLA